MNDVAAPPLLVQTPAALNHCLHAWRGQPWLTVDTEFVRETTYRPQLCLVQVSDGTTAACLDALALDLAPLWALLADERCIKVLHSASQDYEIFLQACGDCPRPLFDTQVAAAMLGIGDQIGYAGLIKDQLGIEVDKRLSRTDWSKRPLSAAALDYAADDVRHLAVVYPRLHAALVQRQRLAWLEEDCARLTDPALYRTEPRDAWRKLRGLGRIPAAAQQAAAALAAWRETEADARNRPRKWVLSDDALYQLALRRPATAADLAALDALPPKTAERHGAALLALLNAAPDGLALLDGAPPSADEKARLQALQSVVAQTAETLGVPKSLLATRADLETLAKPAPAPESLTPLRGWRRAVVGEALLAKAQP